MPSQKSRTTEAVAAATTTGRRLRGRHRDERAWTPLEEQQFHREQNRRHRGGKGGRHAARRAGDQQRGALGVSQVEPLRDERTERAAGHDDGAFRTERSAGADGDGRRERLEHRNGGVHARAANKYGLDGFRHAVAADALGAVTRHHADDQPTDHWHERENPALCAAGGAHRNEADAVVIKNVGEEVNSRQQGYGKGRRADADEYGEAAEQPYTTINGKVSKYRAVRLHRVPPPEVRRCATGLCR
jgi:hypothetical protein